MLRVFVEPGVVDWDVVAQIETRLIYDDPANHFHAERTFMVKSDSPRQEWIVRLTDPALTRYQVQHTWHLKDLSEITGPAENSGLAQLFVGDSFVDRLPITIQPLVDKANIARVAVELHYEDPTNRLDFRKNVELIGPDYRQASVTIPIMDSRRRTYRYRVILIRTNGGVENQPEKETDQLSILVTEGGEYLDVKISFFGDLAQSKVDALQVDLRAEPLDGAHPKVESHLFEPGAEKKTTRRLLVRNDRPEKFEYRTTVFSADRGPMESEWKEHASRTLVLQLARLLNP